MKCWLKHEWPWLALTLLWVSLTIANLLLDANRLAIAVDGLMLGVSIVQATLGHQLWHANRELDGLRSQHVSALVSAFMLHPIEHELEHDGDKALITLEHKDGMRGYQVEIIPSMDGETV
ncbi:hypothetical protein [Bifidobacterium biavatii]|uniref:Uncharacterized protein n=1 Tax=Bifidobacterium biavatii DSM 23969 TaxID=1437608 RepID=A0A086ZU41_9BIFI|nr:hypothetical protein [Bifidobacterium biavatii]KFI50041.1 hypothetical protein BBIA_2174 [Bifidobacterium biavatii DSM 23969]